MCHFLRKGEVVIESQPFPFALLLFKSGEIGIRKGGMPVNGKGEHIASAVEDLLLPVAVMIVYVEDGHPSAATKVMGCYRAVVEVTEPAEDRPLSMVARRPGKDIGIPCSCQQFVSCAHYTVHTPAGCQECILVQGRKGVKTVITGPDREIFWRSRSIPDGKYIGVDRLPPGYVPAYLPEIVEVIPVMHIKYVPVRVLTHPACPEQPAFIQLLKNALYPYGRFHIAPFPDMMNCVPVVDCKPYLFLFRYGGCRLRQNLPACITRRPDSHRIIGYAVNNHVVIFLTGIIAIFSFKDCPYNSAKLIT